MPAPCAGIFLHANYSPFDGRYGADGGPIHATYTPDCRPIRKVPAQPNATPPASDGARPTRFTTRGPLIRPKRTRLPLAAAYAGCPSRDARYCDRRSRAVAAPRLRDRRIAVLVTAPNRLHEEAWAEALVAARSLNVDLIRIEMQEAAGLDAALDSVAKSNANALFVLPDSPPTFNLRRRIIAFARERALPLLAPYREFVEDGALMSYGESYEDAARGVALYVEKVVRGANPAELPIMQPTRFTDGEPEGSERIGDHDSFFAPGAGRLDD